MDDVIGSRLRSKGSGRSRPKQTKTEAGRPIVHVFGLNYVSREPVCGLLISNLLCIEKLRLLQTTQMSIFFRSF